MPADLEDLKKEKPQPYGLRKLAPNDFDEEMDAIKSGLHHVAEKFQKSAPVAEGRPVPVDQLGKRSVAQTFAAMTRLIKDAMPDAAERRVRVHSVTKEKIAVDFEREEESCEKMNQDERNAASKKISAAANKAKEALKSGAARLSSEKNREIGRIAAGAAAEGFGTAFHGVAEGVRALRRNIETRFPKTDKIFKVAGVAAWTSLSTAGKVVKAAGQGIVSAGRGAGKKLQDLKASGALENAKNKLSQGASSAAQGLKQKSENAGARLGKAASGAAAGLKKAGQNVGVRLHELKEKADAKREERRAAREASGAVSAEEKLKALSEKTASRLKNMRSQLSEKTKEIAAEAKSKLRRDRAETSDGGESASLSEKLHGLKDKMTLSAKDLAARAKKRLDALRASEEETPAETAPETPAAPPQPPVQAGDDTVNCYAAEETVDPEMLHDDKKD